MICDAPQNVLENCKVFFHMTYVDFYTGFCNQVQHFRCSIQFYYDQMTALNIAALRKTVGVISLKFKSSN